MAKSMTGFGRAKADQQDMEFTVEVKTLNHRYLDINMRLPKIISFLEEDIRKLVQERLDRGRVDIYISTSVRTKDSVEVEINEPLMESYISCFNEIAQKYGIKYDVSLSTLVGIQDLFLVVEKEQDEETIRELVLKALEEALDKVEDMRQKEGEKLKEDIKMRCGFIRNMLEDVEARAPMVVEEYRTKLRNRIEELIKTTELDENRFNAEVAFFADRSNITEEIVRLRSHLNQMEEILEKEGSIGRKLDFLVQEMNRETNTIGSKANDLIIVNLVVDMKSEIEKIREQVQNIE
ncbi:MAG: YicC family protein [Clostridiales bacterium]|nr:YicC family protein [Clostridiales bacterium]